MPRRWFRRVINGSGSKKRDERQQASQESKPQTTSTNTDQQDEVPHNKPEPPQPYASLVDLWNEAMASLNEYDRREMVELNTKIASESTHPRDVASGLQEQLDEMFKAQNAASKAGHVIESSMRILRAFLSAGDVAVSFDPVHAALPWAAVRSVLVLVTSHFELRNQILTGITMVSSHMAQCDRYHQLYMTPEPVLRPKETVLARLKTSIAETYNKSQIFLSFALRLHRSKSKSMTAAFNLGDVESRLRDLSQCGGSLLQAAEDCETTCNFSNRSDVKQLLELTAKLNNTIQGQIDAIHQLNQRTVDKIDLVLAQIDEKKQMEVLEWISPVKYGNHHVAVEEARTPGTGEWLLRHEKFREWEELHSSAVLWLQGSPGVGKTFLTSKVIEHTRRRLRCSANPEGFAFFYCNRNDEERRQPLSVLRSYVRQLSTTPERPERIRKQLQEQCSELRRNGANLGLSDCSEQLLQSVDLYPKTTLVLDALDECDQSSRRQIVKAIELLLDSSSLVKIFISSRPDGDIRNRFCNIPSIEIRATDNEEDIKKFVRTEMAEHSSWKMFSQDLQRDVIEVLFSKSQGMFQWAFLQVKQLLNLESEAAIRDRLGKLPVGLKDTYDEIYRNIQNRDPHDRNLAENAFKLVASARQALDKEDLLRGIQFDSQTDSFHAAITDSQLLNLCHNLLIFDSETQVWRFSHLSVTEYFEENHWSLLDAHCHTAIVSLKLITLFYKTSVRRSGRQVPFLEYARDNWFHHVRVQEGQKPDSRLATVLKSFLGSREKSSLQYQDWVDHTSEARLFLEDNRTKDIRGYLRPANITLFAMCCFSFYNILQDWWEQGDIDVSLTCQSGFNLLGLAALGGSPRMCQNLIEKHGIHVDSPQKNFFGGSALVVAIGYQHFEVVEYLVQEAGANVNMQVQTGKYGSALVAAISNRRNSDTIKLLLKAGAEVNLELETGTYGSALATAAYYRRHDDLKLLLRLGADVDTQLKIGFYGSALAVGVIHGDRAVVELLLRAGADVNMQLQSGPYGSALAAAAASYISDNFELLLKAGAVVDMELQTGYYGSALVSAAYHGQSGGLELLLRAGADVNMQLQRGKYESALVAAAAGGAIEIIRLLLKAGADVNMDLKTGQHGSILVAALASIAEERVFSYWTREDLHDDADDDDDDDDADNDDDIDYGNDKDYCDILEFLIFDVKVDVNYQIRHGRIGSALAAASFFGLTHSVKLLIEAGADVNLAIENGPFRTALQASQGNSSEEELGDWYDLKGSCKTRSDVGVLLWSHGAKDDLDDLDNNDNA